MKRNRDRRTQKSGRRLWRILLAVCAATVLVAVSWAGPTSVFDHADPISSNSTPAAESIGSHDSNVSTQTGAFEYVYPIAVPPGRGGATPSLTLRYSSQGPLYGTMAAGWTLQLPEIRFDRRSTDLHWRNTGPLGTWRPHRTGWISSLSGNQPLVRSFQLNQPNQPNASDVEATYRAKVDSEYIRYEKLISTAGAAWRARTLDGTVYTFSEPDKMGGSTASLLLGVFPVTSMRDVHGNTVEYFWKPRLRGPTTVVGFDIDSIKYSTHAADASLEPFAEVLFSGNVEECPGTALPIGAELDMSSGARWERGGRLLTGVLTLAKSNHAPGLQRVRLVKFDYYQEELGCEGAHPPIRLLKAITETALSPEGQTTTLPPVTFEYAPIERSLTRRFGIPVALPEGHRSGLRQGAAVTDLWPSLQSMFIDLDGDGLVDHLRSTEIGSGSSRSCGAKFRRNTGLSFSAAVDVEFPTMAWSPGSGVDEGCSLTAQFTKFSNDTSTGCTAGSYLAYRFVDVHGDGLPDLIVAAHRGRPFDPNRGDALPYQVPACVDQAGCPSLAFWNCAGPRLACRPGIAGLTCPNPASTLAACQQSVGEVPCGVKMFSAAAGSGGGAGTGEPCVCQDCGTVTEYGKKCNCIAVADPGVDGGFKCDEDYLPFPTPGGDLGSPIDPPTDLPPQCGQGPHVQCGRYPWAIYKNIGGQFDLERPHVILSPIPLESNADGTNFGPTTRGFHGSGHGLLDINGDGLVDAVVADKGAFRLEEAGKLPEVDSTVAFFAFLGDGEGNFHPNPLTGTPYVFPTPRSVRLSRSRRIKGVGQPSAEEIPTAGSPWTFANGTFGTLRDMNGDGLVDLLWTDPEEDEDGPEGVFTFFNLGAAFENWNLATPTPWRLTNHLPHAGRTFIEVTDGTTQGVGLNQSIIARVATASNDVRLLDFDGDGRVDLFNPTPDPSTGKPNPRTRLLFGRGDGTFARELTESAAVLDGGAGRPSAPDLVRGILTAGPFRPYPWIVAGDFFDITGDGLPDVIRGHEVLTDDYGDHPPRLMNRVRNGQGLVVEVSYGQHNESDGAIDNENGDPVPNPFFVVKHVDQTLGLCVDPANPTDDECRFVRTSYKYKNMVFNEADGHWRFRGFRSAFEIKPADEEGRSATKEARYDYSVDATGRLGEVIVYPLDPTSGATGSAAVTTVRKIKSIELPGPVTSYVVEHVDSWQCGEGETYAECTLAEPRRQRNEWRRFGDVVYAIDEKTDQLSSDEDMPGNRRVVYANAFISDENHHLLRTIVEERLDRGESGWQRAGLTRTTWSPDWSTQDRITQLEAREGPAHDTLFEYDIAGNVRFETRPRQSQLSPPGPPVEYRYDDEKLFVVETINEEGQLSEQETHYGTGELLEARGPIQSSGRRLVEKYKIDGFGRVLEVETMDDMFDLHLVETNAYIDDSIPSKLINKKLVDFSGEDWVTTETSVDGLGRVVETRTDAGELGWDTQTYGYDDLGRLVTFTTPHPDHGGVTGDLVTYRYQYDSTDRLKKVVLPIDAASNPTGDTYVDHSYDGYETTRRECVGVDCAELHSEKVMTVDRFGRLVAVAERIDNSGLATTQYEYDGNDNLSKVVDAEGNQTVLTHDWLNRRTGILRGGREWRYQYDGHGNMVARIAPYDVANPDFGDETHTLATSYDALDRPESRTVSRHDLSSSEASEFAVGTTLFEYDDCENGVGKLCAVRYHDGLGDTLYGYDPRGNVVEELRHVVVPGTPGPLDVVRTRFAEYNSLGQPKKVWLPDGESQDDSFAYEIDYDSRGQPTAATGIDPSATPPAIALAELTRNLAGRIKLRTGAIGGSVTTEQASEWTYDAVGRVTAQSITAPINSVAQSLVGQSLLHSPHGDVRLLTHSVGSETRRFSYAYDQRHQLTTVKEGVSEDPFLDLTYTAAGRIETSQVHTTDARNVSYDYGDSGDPETVKRLENIVGGDTHTSFEYDQRGNLLARTDVATGSSIDFSYDGREQLREADAGAGREVYFYDHDGNRMLSVTHDDSGSGVQRVRFWFGGVETIWHKIGNDLVPDKSIARINLGQPIARIERPGHAGPRVVKQVYHSPLEHLLASVDDSGSLVAGFIYGPFGSIPFSEGSETASHERRFNGKDFDSISGLSYYGFRYYDRLAMTWTQSDPLYRFLPDLAFDEPRRLNLYTFSLNNPTRYVDPDGRDVWERVGGLVDIVVGTVEAAGGGALIVAPEPGTTVAGLIVAADAADRAGTGFRRLITGKPQTTVGQAAVTGLARALGASDPEGIGRGFEQARAAAGMAAAARGAWLGAQAIKKAKLGSTASKAISEPTVSNPKLHNLVNDLYKGAKTKRPIGTGSTADAIRYETRTGNAVGGTFHTDKGRQYRRALEKWLRKNPDASRADRKAAQSMLDDLTDALGGE